MSKGNNQIGCINIIVAIIVILGVMGYILDIVNLCQCDFASPYKAEVIYAVGAITGLGAILGWFNFGK